MNPKPPTLMKNQPAARALSMWFQPWDYAHPSWLTQMPALHAQERVWFYPFWCQQLGLMPCWQPYNDAWLIKHVWRIPQATLTTALEILGVMLDKQATHQLSPEQLRWAYQIGLARPLVLKIPQALNACTSAFDLGLNLLAQLFFCHAQSMWTRFLLKFEQAFIAKSYIYPYPLLRAPMLVIVEKRWQRILAQLG